MHIKKETAKGGSRRTATERNLSTVLAGFPFI